MVPQAPTVSHAPEPASPASLVPPAPPAQPAHARPAYRAFAWFVLAFTLAVILWGAYVRATGSGAGCGSSWPTCNGEIIPRARSVQTVIEFTHRATSGLSFLLVLAQLVWSRRALAPGDPGRRAAAASMLLMTTEALVGAGLVLFEMVAGNKSLARAAWMAAHLTNTFLLVASIALSAYFASGGPAPVARGQGRALAAGVAALGGTLLLGVSGAIAALGDTLFPASSLVEGLRDDLSATAHMLVKLRVLHPVIGLTVCGYLLVASGVITQRRATPLVRRLAALAAGAFVGQVALGFVNMALLAPVALQLVHLLMADVVWLSIVLLVTASLAPDPASAPPPLGAARASAA